MRAVVFGILLFLPAAGWGSETQEFEQHAGRVLSRIVITGNTKTEDRVILAELDVRVGQALSVEDLHESFRRVFNLRIFSEVEFRLQTKNANQSELTIQVTERWTLIPIAKLTGGGGTTQFTLGAYDINTAGSFLEVGAQYENLNGQDGFVHWFRNPRVFGNRLRVGYDFWNVTRNRVLFDSNVAKGSKAKDLNAYTVKRQTNNFFIEKEFVYWFLAGFGFDHTRLEATEQSLGDKFLELNQRNHFKPPPLIEETAYTASLQLGRLNYTNDLVDGFQTNLNLRYADEGLGGNENSYRAIQSSKAFWVLPREQNIGLHFSTGFTNSANLQNNFFVGGFENVRGFLDGQFLGQHFWQANAEYRVTAYKAKSFAIQKNIFFDAGNVSSGEASTLFDNPRQPFQSVGAGFRLMSPSIYRFNLRVDFAQALNVNGAFDVSFGLQQFF